MAGGEGAGDDEDAVTTSLRGCDAGLVDWPHSHPPLVTSLFAKHRGRTYPQAVAVAQQAQVYREQVEGTALTLVATFARTAQQASAASQLLELTVSLKGSAVLPRRDQRPVCPAGRVRAALSPRPPGRSLAAAVPLDQRAYLAFDAHYPASATSLIQAAAVRNGSQRCPNFDAAAFRRWR